MSQLGINGLMSFRPWEGCFSDCGLPGCPHNILFIVKPFMLKGLLPQPFGQVLSQKKGCLVSFLLLPCFIAIPVLNANSDLGLHCLQMSIWHKWVNLMNS